MDGRGQRRPWQGAGPRSSAAPRRAPPGAARRPAQRNRLRPYLVPVEQSRRGQPSTLVLVAVGFGALAVFVAASAGAFVVLVPAALVVVGALLLDVRQKPRAWRVVSPRPPRRRSPPGRGVSPGVAPSRRDAGGGGAERSPW